VNSLEAGGAQHAQATAMRCGFAGRLAGHPPQPGCWPVRQRGRLLGALRYLCMTDELPEEPTIEAPARIVEAFLYALRDKKWDTFGSAMDDNIVYHNVGTPIINGRRRAVKFLRRMFDRPSGGFDVKIHRIAVEGTSVLTERTDVMVFGPFRMHFWVCGVFEVRNGKITLWRDYFDSLDMLKAAVRGLAGVAVPSLKPTL
jgi:limonene-1,2-epoxide hydrolase